MTGTKRGGKKASQTNKERHGKSFYRQIGSIGGRATGAKGFARNPELAKIAGRKGGKKSSREGVKTGQGKKREYIEVDEKWLDPIREPKQIKASTKEPEPKAVSSTRWLSWFNRGKK